MSIRNLTADNLPADYKPTDLVELQARLEAYLDNLEYNRRPVAEMVYDERFKSDEWPHDVYVPMTADLRAILTELDHFRRALESVLATTAEWSRLAPVDANGETQWGKTPMDTKIAELGRQLERQIEEAWRGDRQG